jgi:uncharacterized protein (DUF2147 family)
MSLNIRFNWLHRELTVVLATLMFVACIFFGISDSEAADKNTLIGNNDEQKIVGQWIRPDGGYMLEIKEIGKDGKMKAAYFNPMPINVSRSELVRNQNAITITVELRDVNYPGSTYNLMYDPKTDRLAGTYFQAVEGVTYEIEFVRKR